MTYIEEITRMVEIGKPAEVVKECRSGWGRLEVA
jgi:hypothetical protein